MKPTPKTLQSMYEMVCNLKPFVRWPMPNTGEIQFVVTNDEDCYGSYVFDNVHIITISKAKCAHFETILKTLCHELIHLKIAGPTGDRKGWDQHDYKFKLYSKQVADEFGFDHLEL
jgi:hypothetical protein